MERQYNHTIHRILRDRDWNQRTLRRLTGLHETRVSLIVNGSWVPSAHEQHKISKVLGVPREHLFKRD